MCGIAGIYRFNQEIVTMDQIKAMTDSISHRGPDGEGQWIHNKISIALGHRRLSIIDLSDAASQPMHSSCGKYTIVFNGEIYNYLELKKELEEKGEVFITKSDTEVLLRLFIRDSYKCLNKLDGMWSFAIWDEEAQVLFCSRDRFGEKPFYYYFDQNCFYFASEMKALWAIGISKIPNENMFELFNNTGKVYNPSNLSNTFYQNIFQLPHSHYLTVSKDSKIEIVKYYDINWGNQNFQGNLEEAKTTFKKLLIDSIQKRFRSDVTVGTSLSGGLDSSSIVCTIEEMNRINPIKLETFSARFDNFTKDEGEFIQEVVLKTKFNNHKVWPNEDALSREWNDLCYHQEEPFGSTSIYAQYKVFELAKKHNVTVLVDGQGADEILSGYLYYYYNYILYLFKNKSFFYTIKQYRKYIDNHSNLKGLKKFLVKNLFLFFFNNRSQLIKNIKPLNQMLYESTFCGDLQELLKYADRNSMAHGVEIRLPFLSKDLVEFCFSLPDEYKLNNGWTKSILRESLASILPNKIVWRKEKVGFETPQNSWIKSKKMDWKALMKKEFYFSNL